MFVLVSEVHRSGAICREYYQPEEQGFVPGVVFGLDAMKRAKQYLTEEEAARDIPAFKSLPGFSEIYPEVHEV